MARLNFCHDVLMRVGVLSFRDKRQLKPLDLTRMVFSDEKFFRWQCTQPRQNRPIWVTGARGRPPRKADLDQDMCTNEHSQRNLSVMEGAAMVNGIVSRPVASKKAFASTRSALRAMIVRTMSSLDPDAAQKDCIAKFIHRCLACMRARGDHFAHRL